jgi:16S rRNA (cytosine967-C5)-methyltransferase
VELSYGMLRRQGSLDAVIDACAHRSDIDPVVRDLLRLGSYQLLFTRVARHAAVAETVELAKRRAGRGATGFCNAVLRAVEQRDWPSWLQQLSVNLPPVERLALEHSFPPWVVRALMAGYGVDVDGVAPILAACNVPAHVVLAARPGQCDVDELLALPGAQRGQRSRYAVVLPRGTAPGAVTAVREQRAGVQDEGSQLVALALADAPLSGSDREWLDLCAGPGGKAALLAGLVAQRGGRLTAVEVNPVRAKLVSSALQHAPGDPEVVVADGRSVDCGRLFDRVLVDAPCTGLGALRRRPEARWRRQPSDIPVLTALQRELLDHAATLVRPSGLLEYATCSPHVAETHGIVEDFLRRHSDFAECAPRMLLRPDVDGTDGMFAALLQRQDQQ